MNYIKTFEDFKVVFDGFETEEDAKSFANWYEGSGEQNASDGLDKDLTVDMTKYHQQGGFKSNDNNEIIVPLKK